MTRIAEGVCGGFRASLLLVSTLESQRFAGHIVVYSDVQVSRVTPR